MRKCLLYILGVCLLLAAPVRAQVLVKDINQVDKGSGPSELIYIDDTLFFTAEDSTHGRELWKSDGTEEGTVLVKDIQPGGVSAFPRSLTDVEGVLFFVAGEQYSRHQLWRSDGT